MRRPRSGADGKRRMAQCLLGGILKEGSMAERATTDKQQRILDVIRQFTSERGYPPSVREIGERVGLSSSSTVQSHLKTLERRGLLRRDPTKPRALVAPRGDDFQRVESATLAAGRPRRGRRPDHGDRESRRPVRPAGVVGAAHAAASCCGSRATR